jgi:hypothetical protein
MKKKYIIIGVAAAVIAFLAFCGKAEAQEVEQEKTWKVDITTGYYEKRISGGLYGAQDVAYIKGSTKLGVFAGLSFVSGVEYVNSDNSQFHTSLGTYLDTPIGGIDTRFVMHSIENADTSYELEGTYGYIRFGTLANNIPVFVQVNALKNNQGIVNNISSEGTDGDFDVTFTAGLAFSF